MRVGWYVHHHGTGHLQRFLAVREHLTDVVGLSSLERPEQLTPSDWVTLPIDAPAASDGDPTAGGVLHWAPLRHAGLRDRMAGIAAWIAAARPHVLVCDVSVEVALLARLMGVPVVWIAQRGVRRDAPHQLAFSVATVVAPWTAAVAGSGTGLPATTRFVGAISRFDGRASEPPPDRRKVTVVLGGGGHEVGGAQVRAAAQAVPRWSWTIAGLGLGETVGEPVRDRGTVADTWPLLCDADVVVASAGGNLVAEVAAARRPLVCLPQRRPFDEQHDGAAALARAGLAETLSRWPDPEQWPEVLARARTRDPRDWEMLHDGRGAQRLAAEIRACASA
jgi:UDP-N-acetylglucosamine:LPS N-acetylglucosamine transferase